MTELIDTVVQGTDGAPTMAMTVAMTERELKHELRQSLAVIALAGGILDRRPAQDPRVRTWIEQVRCEAEWMDRLLRGAGAGDPVPVDAGSVVTRVWETVLGRSDAALALSREAGAWVRTVPVALERCVRDLVEHAVRAAGPHGEVAVGVARSGGSVVIQVDSAGGRSWVPAPPQIELRAVSRFAADHGGVVEVARSPRGGARVRLVLPPLTGLDERGRSA